MIPFPENLSRGPQQVLQVKAIRAPLKKHEFVLLTSLHPTPKVIRFQVIHPHACILSYDHCGKADAGEQEFKGAPHRRSFPANDEAGKFLRESGIAPLKELQLKLKTLTLWRSRFGIFP
ncbi:aspartate carbamoyltransferase regulatory chain [Striga asiatica]|uniref:Aspartate carbamoyltransferase regulatory chain n=1 Tax=Striga asiatica TaxID=4170 RepID=A0A5A7QMY3_STRAF|nr:aspartate carbamoyltransferase regulatory chain [Striga asiatica]